jgi:hypothetical protein
MDYMEALEDTIAFWQPRACRQMTLEDARQAVANISGFFETLDRWASAPKPATGDCDMEAA